MRYNVDTNFIVGSSISNLFCTIGDNHLPPIIALIKHSKINIFITKIRKFLTRIGLCKYRDISSDDRNFAYCISFSRGKLACKPRDYFQRTTNDGPVVNVDIIPTRIYLYYGSSVSQNYCGLMIFFERRTWKHPKMYARSL